MTVLAFDPTHSRNAERVADLARLGYLPEPVLDPSYGLGGMWRNHTPDRLVTLDLDPIRRTDIQADYRHLPFPDATFGSVLLDPPYRLAGTATNQGGMDNRYGIGRYRPVADVHAELLAALDECLRVTRPRGFVIVKCQAQVCGGRPRWQPRLVAEHAERDGHIHIDELHLQSGRQQPGDRIQRRARRNYSTFVVLEVK